MAKRTKKKKKSPRRTSPAQKFSTIIWKGIVSKFARMDKKAWLQALLIVAAGVWIFWPALQGRWLWDDDVLVADNFELRSWAGLWSIWFAAPPTDYWPLSWTVLWIEWHLWGNNPLGYHLVSLALHLCSGFLIWRLFNRLGLRGGWIGGLLFVVHPLAVESAAWIAEIKNTLSLPLFLLSCDAWLDGEEDRKGSGYLRSVLYYLAAMLAKTSTVMLPLVLLLYGWWKRGKITWSEIKRMLPYGVIALILGLVTVYLQSHSEAAASIKMGGFFARLTGAGMGLCFYLGKFLLPIGLVPIYPRWVLDPPSLLQIMTVPLLAALGFGLWTRRKGWGRHALFGLGFFVLNLLPVLGLVKMGYLINSSVADHFVYLPMIGLIGLTVAGWEQAEKRLTGDFRPVGIGILAVVVALLTWESHRHARIFINQESFWTCTLRSNPQSCVAHNNLGSALADAGRLPEAMEHYEQALKTDPDNAEVHNNLGVALAQTGKVTEAIEHYEHALKFKPDFVEVRNNLGVALTQTGRRAEAMAQFEQALKIDPDDVEAYNNLGLALEQAGRLPEAMGQFEQALKIDPDYAEIHNNLGMALTQTGREGEALEQFEQAVILDPNLAEAHNNLGEALLHAGRTSEVLEQFEQAVKLNPDLAEAHNNLGDALLHTGRASEAIEQFERVLKFRPDEAEAHNNLGIALAQTGLVPEAIGHFEQALRLRPDYAEAHNNLGNALAQIGRLTEAREQFEQTLKLKPNDAKARNNLEQLEARQKAASAKKSGTTSN